MAEDKGMVKVAFSLECEDDWPPVAVERVWASTTGDPEQYTIENTPFFARAATLGDVVIAKRKPMSDEDDSTTLWFQERVKWGGNALIRLIVRKPGRTDAIAAWLQAAGCVCEGFDRFAMVAVSIPPQVEQSAVQAFLLQCEGAGDVYVEEAILRD